jgi:hypothetical protein
LTTANLVALAIEDAGVTMPIPFDPGQWYPGWPDWALLHHAAPETQQWIEQALAGADQPRPAYLRSQASLLGIEVPSEESLAGLPTPPAHERWLELPGTGGWVAYVLSTRPDANLYFWENFTIVCTTPPEMILAGLIAWELGAPPYAELPIQLDDPNLSKTLKAGQSYDTVVGPGDRHSHRDLRVLHQTGQPPRWL